MTNPTLIIFSGLPCTGKTTLARKVAGHLGIPLLRIDDLVTFIPQAMREQADPYWETLINILLNLAEAQLAIGVSVMVDSVFMGVDRRQAEQIAILHQAIYRPIHSFVSDEMTWRKRVERRAATAPPEDGAATWEQIQEQRKSFQPWAVGSALFVDAMESVDDNFSSVFNYLTGEDDYQPPNRSLIDG